MPETKKLDLSSLNLDQIKPFLPFLLPLIPEFVNVGGKKFPLRSTATKALEDGKFDEKDLVAALMAWVGAAPAEPAAPPVVVVPPAPPKPPVVVPPAPPEPEMPKLAAIEFDFEVYGRTADGQPPLSFQVVNQGAVDELVLVNGPTTNLPITSQLNLHLKYIGTDGQPFSFPEGSIYDHTSQLRVEALDGSGAVEIGPGAYAEMITEGVHVANFREAEYHRTRGMDPIVKFPPAADGKQLILMIEALGKRARALKLPMVS